MLSESAIRAIFISLFTITLFQGLGTIAFLFWLHAICRIAGNK